MMNTFTPLPCGKLLAAFFFFCSASFLTAASAQTAELIKLLKQPGTHAIMRHALAPGYSDPASFRINDCSTQRNLNEAGRDQARRTGKALEDAGVKFTQVLTSQWCRCRETAKLLGLGEPQDLPALNSFFENRSAAGQQTSDLKNALKAMPSGEKIMLVTHQVNITAFTGRGTSSGEVVVFKMDDSGVATVLGEFALNP